MSTENVHHQTTSPRGELADTLNTSNSEQTVLLDDDHSDRLSKARLSPLCHTGTGGSWWKSPGKAEGRTPARIMRHGGRRHGLRDKANSKLEKFRMARSLAIQWLSLLMQNPPDAATIQAYRNMKLQHRQQQEKQGREHAEPSSAEGGLAKGTSFAEVVRRGFPSSSSCGLSAASDAVLLVDATSDVGTQHDRNVGSSSIQPSAETFELVPEDEKSVSEIIRALREIALTGASLGTNSLEKEGNGTNGVGSLSTAMGCSGAGTGVERVEGGSSLVSNSIGSSGSNGAKSCNRVAYRRNAESQWEDIKLYFSTVHRLVQNREELTFVLDTVLGTGWCVDGGTSPKDSESSFSAGVTLPPSQAAISAIESPRASSFPDRATEHKPKQQEEEEADEGHQQMVVIDNVKVHSTLNHKAVPFESRLHSVLASPPLSAAPYYFSGRSTSTPAADPHTNSPVSFSTPPLRQCGGVALEIGSSVMPSASTTVSNGTTPPTGPSLLSSNTAFKLESREDMIRRRTAAAAAAAANYAHTTSGNYYGNRSRGTWSGSVSPLLSFMNPVLSHSSCPYDYLLVLDFEATCEESTPPSYLHEIIEFPVVMVDVRLQRAVAEFHHFVKPKVNPKLSEFCRQLTGIRQEDIDNALPLEDVIRRFERWHAQTIPPGSRTMLATDGPTDLKEFMYIHSVSRQGIRFPSMFYQWIDVKRFFAHFFQCQQGKIKAMLDALNCPFEGRLHSGIDDARNVATIVIRMLKLGCTFCEIPLSRLPYGATTTTASLVAPEIPTTATETIKSDKNDANASLS
ncbi:hypothetical protein MOQ_003040 [Trypanosoma cruzi marinkellei]|uniref:Exonuclease domain-containing protein n=1 Tax=Trypanosoma cruzi marinkellei TaxID=85056 RepID=K2MD70_TRYCR|nr:hypothetical protein MOQ_003040 [Trypanosoma cruzi marinkellei]